MTFLGSSHAFGGQIKEPSSQEHPGSDTPFPLSKASLVLATSLLSGLGDKTLQSEPASAPGGLLPLEGNLRCN